MQGALWKNSVSVSGSKIGARGRYTFSGYKFRIYGEFACSETTLVISTVLRARTTGRVFPTYPVVHAYFIIEIFHANIREISPRVYEEIGRVPRDRELAKRYRIARGNIRRFE